MASKKKAKTRKTSAKKKKKRAKKAPLLITPFMDAFTAQFLRNPATKDLLWPPANQADSVTFQIIGDVAAVLGNARTGVQPVSGGTTSFHDQVVDFVNTQNWPHTAIPKYYKKMPATVHLVEIAVILDRMLEAVNEGSGGGGGGSSWPPHP